MKQAIIAFNRVSLGTRDARYGDQPTSYLPEASCWQARRQICIFGRHGSAIANSEVFQSTGLFLV